MLNRGGGTSRLLWHEPDYPSHSARRAGSLRGDVMAHHLFQESRCIVGVGVCVSVRLSFSGISCVLQPRALRQSRP